MVKVKICGITRPEDALQAVRFGADALGFVFADSPRQVSVSRARAILQRLGPWPVATVGVFVNEDPRRIKRIAGSLGLTAVQWHGEEEPRSLREILRPLKVIRAFRIASATDLGPVRRSKADAFLFDAKVNGKYGGTGRTFDWGLLREFRTAKPVILSGGLDAQNIRRAVRMVRPYGVDVSSGVEKSPGRKDPERIREFMLNAKKI